MRSGLWSPAGVGKRCAEHANTMNMRACCPFGGIAVAGHDGCDDRAVIAQRSRTGKARRVRGGVKKHVALPLQVEQCAAQTLVTGRIPDVPVELRVQFDMALYVRCRQCDFVPRQQLAQCSLVR